MLAITDPIEPTVPDPASSLDYVLYPVRYYLQATGVVLWQAFTRPDLLWQGVKFSAALLSILAAHESGHYIACRRYNVRATLPFFLPAPPLFLAGTFGAFIKIQSPIGSRRALFDIAVAGPLAGFAVIIPVTLAALLTRAPAPPELLTNLEGMIVLNDPPLLQLLAWTLNIDLSNIAPNPFYFAAWIGLLVTSLNLLPVSQLDGGHTTYALFGKPAHRALGLIAFAGMLMLALLGWQWHNTPGGLLYAVLLFILLRMPHPQVRNEAESLGPIRLAVAVLTLIVFLLAFTPFPISIP